MIETIRARIEELKSLEQEKAQKNASLELELRDIDKKRDELQGRINDNLWANLSEKKELDRLLIVLEEIERLGAENG